ncbi:MAG: hypothetical protein C4567_05210, partial [Deltaproteobacteria bacterium]
HTYQHHSGSSVAPGGGAALATNTPTDTGNTGGGEAHSHGMDNTGDWRPAYVDVIACTKD